MDAVDLAAAVEQNVRARQLRHRDPTVLPDAAVAETAGVLLTSLRPYDAVLNVALVRAHSADAGVVQEVREFFAGRGSCQLWVPQHARSAADIVAAARRAGFTGAAEDVGMARDVGAARPPGVDLPGWRVAAVDSRTHAGYLTVAAAFGMGPELSAALFTESVFSGPDGAGLVGYLDREPVTACQLLRTGAVAGVHGVATLPEYRRRGLVRRLLDAAAVRAADWGCQALVLLTVDPPPFARSGFREVSRYTNLRGPDDG